MKEQKPLHEANRHSWNAATIAHNSHKGDQAAFFRGGGSTLFPEERELLGELAGKTLVHLQCNAGQDTLSLVRLGAEVTGVDISDEAIGFARVLSHDSGIPATFVRADIYHWFAEARRSDRRYEIVFASYGVKAWLSDLEAWAAGIEAVLEPGGRFVLVEFHPLLDIFDEEMKLVFPYFTDGAASSYPEGIGDYVADSREGLAPGGLSEGVREFRNPHPSHEWHWGLGDVVSAVAAAGLRIETLREYPYSNGWMPFRGMRRGPGRRMYPPDGVPSLPLMFGLVARHPG